MKKYKNECTNCGRPAIRGGLCGKCLNLPIQCITAPDHAELARIVAIKESAGMAKHGEPLPLSKAGPYVQMMV